MRGKPLRARSQARTRAKHRPAQISPASNTESTGGDSTTLKCSRSSTRLSSTRRDTSLNCFANPANAYGGVSGASKALANFRCKANKYSNSVPCAAASAIDSNTLGSPRLRCDFLTTTAPFLNENDSFLLERERNAGGVRLVGVRPSSPWGVLRLALPYLAPRNSWVRHPRNLLHSALRFPFSLHPCLLPLFARCVIPGFPPSELAADVAFGVTDDETGLFDSDVFRVGFEFNCLGACVDCDHGSPFVDPGKNRVDACRGVVLMG